MRFYNRQHQYYCGIDLHVKTMYVCILDAAGQVRRGNEPRDQDVFVHRVSRRHGDHEKRRNDHSRV